MISTSEITIISTKAFWDKCILFNEIKLYKIKPCRILFLMKINMILQSLSRYIFIRKENLLCSTCYVIRIHYYTNNVTGSVLYKPILGKWLELNFHVNNNCYNINCTHSFFIWSYNRFTMENKQKTSIYLS